MGSPTDSPEGDEVCGEESERGDGGERGEASDSDRGTGRDDRPPARAGGRSSGSVRRAVEARLDAAVEENRFTIAVVFPLVGAALFVASHEGVLPGWLAMNPLLVLFGTLVMRLPLVAGFAPLVTRRAAAGLAVLTAYTYAIEYVGVTYGIPYGDFRYLLELGPMLAGVPVGLPVFFLPLVLNSYLLVLLFVGPRDAPALRARRALAALGVVLVVDLVLDPAAVALGFWRYEAAGAYYGVPVSNYLGWLLSGLVAVSLVEFAFDRRALFGRLADCPFMLDDLVSFIVLWGAMNAYFRNWVPVALALALFVGLVRTERFDFDVFGRRRSS
ncbi:MULTISPECIES: bisanhydrobacterioruberin hydratase [Halorussus]|uniref:bisanhydrobacterioruberin hydratase n=1 Tax=Halorussus TaxID=1070314 RepID=UPI00209DE91F|nr:bisanhydrobacterioruberin hydratase [Halorussus vallis]USZ75908.1 carotenoid biosynthesis protein [Halorussus vallis]